MRRITVILSCILNFTYLQGQDKTFAVSKIPAGLTKNCNSVLREERIEFQVTEIGKAVYKVHRVVTVLNENANDELVFQAYSSQFRIFESCAIQIFDGEGNSIQKFKRSDLSTQVTGSGLVPDGKTYYLKLPVSSYPVTVQFDYEIKFKGILTYPSYHLQVPEQSVESSTFTALVPSDLDLRYKAKNTSLAPESKTEVNTKRYTWSVKNMPAKDHEPGSVAASSGYPHILLAPNKFAYGGFAGEMNTWESFGKWFELIAKNTNNLSEESKQFIRSLVKDAPDEREKVRIIYNYLQQNFRYVSIQLGMGGLIPFEADFVDKKKYGDCKALSNYTLACLDAVGIKSHYALINAAFNSPPVDPAFPYDGFDHVILCVPQPKDSIWLECTSNTNAFGVLGNFTENRNALLITKDGGKLVPTPKSKSVNNIFSSTSTIQLLPNGSGSGDIKLEAKGYYEDIIRYFGTQIKDDQKSVLVNYFGYLNPDNFEVTNDIKNKNAPTTIKFEINKVHEFTAGSKMFLNPRIHKIWNSGMPAANNRTQDFYFQSPFIKTDTCNYKLADGLTIETLPKAKKITFEYGSFHTSYEYDETQKILQSVARLELTEYKIPANKFSATYDFFNQVAAEYNEKLVIKKL